MRRASRPARAPSPAARRPPDWPAWRRHVARLHAAALEAADPRGAVERALRWDGRTLRAGSARWRLRPEGRLWLVAFGKASLGMARGALSRFGDRVAGGVVVHPIGARPGAGWSPSIRFLPGAHPLPTAESLRAGRAVAACASRARAGDLLLVLLSGGGSAMVEWPREGLRLSDLGRVTRALQRAGADIAALNTVRRAISRLKGGGLGRIAGGADLLTLALSDVVGDSPEAIASGPTVPSPTRPSDALDVLRSKGIARAHPRIVAALRNARREGARGAGSAGSRAGRREGRRHYVVVGSNRRSAAAAADAARRLGFRAVRVGPSLVGEARLAGERIAAAARRRRERAGATAPPTSLVYGGETTVTIRGRGRGGRNLEIALGAARALRGVPRVAVASFATDGWDGTSGAAGAAVTGATWARALRHGLDPVRALAANDTAPLLRALGALIVTGRSGTNVNDLTIALIYPAPRRGGGARRSPRRSRSARSRG